ncbi:MAG TPA: prolyl oligopeptidase family serine peptidase [Methylomirabilota bacterium]|nr:prolyl oligopeptidase family serine peptidase [Methylomirabilota bacterium]
MLVERTHYFAKAGRAAEVLATRRRASEVRVALGLPYGRILARADPGGEGPDVTWECAFPDPIAHARDLEVRGRSPEFAAVRARMTALIDRFERLVLVPDPDASATTEPDAARPVTPVEVRVPSGDRALAGYFYVPPGTGPFPALVLNHGSTIDPGTSDFCRPGTAAVLTEWGYAVLLPHRRGYGNSEGPTWRQEVTAEFGTAEYDRALAARLAREAEDVVAAVGWLGSRPEVAADRMGVIGSSFGGVMSLLTAARCPGLRCAVDFAGAAMNWERTPILRATMLEAARQLALPVALVQAENDYSTAPTRELGAELRRHGKIHAARVFPAFGLTADEGHLFFQNGAPIWGSWVRAFLDRWLAGR